MNQDELKAALEALIFASPVPLERRRMAEILAVDSKAVGETLKLLQEDYESPSRGLRLTQVAGGYRMSTRPELHEWVSRLAEVTRPARLSFAALETLSVVAYKQPITQVEIQEIRGVNCSGVLRTLLERKLVKVMGRKKVVGRPLLYGTTDEFLVHFGLRDVSELPSLQEFEEILQEEGEGFAAKMAAAGVAPPEQTAPSAEAAPEPEISVIGNDEGKEDGGDEDVSGEEEIDEEIENEDDEEEEIEDDDEDEDDGEEDEP